AVGEVVRDDRDEDEQARARAEVEREPDAEPVDEAVNREPGGAEDTDVVVRPRLLLVVAVVQYQPALREEERQEACADEPGGAPRIADRVDRLGEDVEQRDRHDHAARECDQRVQVASHADRHPAAQRGRDGGQRSQRDRDPDHARTVHENENDYQERGSGTVHGWQNPFVPWLRRAVPVLAVVAAAGLAAALAATTRSSAAGGTPVAAGAAWAIEISVPGQAVVATRTVSTPPPHTPAAEGAFAYPAD